MKLFKRKTIIIAFLVVIFVLAGIYPMLHKKKANVEETSNTLKLYAIGTDSRVTNQLQDTLDEFQKKYPNIKIKKVLFDGNNIEKYEKTLLSDTLAGKGPDVLYLTSNDAKKLQKSGMLEDLKTLIDKDKSFNKQDYNNKIINAGMYTGKLTLMPLDYYVNQYVTTKERLNSNGINLKPDFSEKDFIKSVESGNLNGSRKLFAAVGADIGDNMGLSDFLAGSGYQFIDYENKKVYFDKPEFKELIEDYKKIYKASSKKDEEESTSGEEGLQALKSGAALFSNDRIESFKDFLSSESLINGITKETSCINNMPMLNGGNKVVGIVADSMAINKNSKNKGAAYNFIKCALSTEVQAKASGQTACIPVNNKVVKELEDEYKSGIGKSYEYDKNDIVVQKPLSSDFQNYVNKITNNVEKGAIIDDSVNNLMMECLTPYFEDKISYESALNTLQSKVKIYINE